MSMLKRSDPGLLYLNKPQLLSYLIDANRKYHVWGRGTGKSSGPLAINSRRNLVYMPGETGINIGATYQQILTRTIPSLINGWSKLGLVQDRDYVIGKRPSPKLGFAEPVEPPQKRDHFIHFKNGSGIHLVSQDINGSSNGLNCAWIMGDEAKYIDYDKMAEETFPTLRSGRDRFGDLHFYRSQTFTTSMPHPKEHKWILDKEKEMNSKDIATVLAIATKIMELHYIFPNASDNQKKSILRQIKKYEKAINPIRNKLTHFSEASSLENLAVLGAEYIREMKRNLPEFLFLLEILNQRPKKIEGGFYRALDYRKHTYSSYNNTFLESLSYDVSKILSADCSQDEDINYRLPFRLGIDWGSAINTMTIGQFNKDENVFRFLKCMHVLGSENKGIDDLADLFTKYYSKLPQRTKRCVLSYDPSGDKKTANSKKTFAQQFALRIKKKGWKVVVRSRSSYASHMDKYLLWDKILSEKDPGLLKVRFNRHNCEDLLTSMSFAPVKEGRNDALKKDKSSEDPDSPFEPQHATHYSDAADYSIVNLFRFSKVQSSSFVDVLST